MVHLGMFSSTVKVLWYAASLSHAELLSVTSVVVLFQSFPSINSKATQRTQMINIGARNVKNLSQGWKNWSIISIFHLIRKVRKMSHRWTPTMLDCYNSSNCSCSCRSWANSNNTTTTRQFYLHCWSMWSIVCVLLRKNIYISYRLRALEKVNMVCKHERDSWNPRKL